MNQTYAQRALVIALILAVVAAPAFAGVAVADEDPPNPTATYYGEVDVAGSDAPAMPITVKAVVDGEVRDSIETDADGTFGGSELFDEKLSVPGESGDQVDFVIGETTVKSGVEWESGANEEITLTPAADTAIDVQIELGSTSVTEGSSTEITVTVTEIDGNENDVSGAATIKSSDTSVATISGTAVTGQNDGTATIEATYDGITTSTDLTVEQPSTSGGGGDTGDGDTGDEDVDEQPTVEPPEEEQPTEEPPEEEQPAEEEPEPIVADSPDKIKEIVPETVELPEDVNTTRAEVNNVTVDPETNRSRVTFSNESTTESISFEETTSGSTTVVELDRAPEETGDPPGESVAVSQIVVPEEAQDSPATIRNSVPIERVEETAAEPEDLTVTRFNDEAGEWQVLETEVLEVTDTRVRLEAETPGFSYFAVTAIDKPVVALDAPPEVEVGEEATFDASDSTDEYTEIVAYDWTVDGASVDGDETLTYIFDSPGEIVVEVTVENEAGKTNTTSTEVLVLEEEETVTTTEVEDTTEEQTTTETTTEPTTTETETPGFTLGLSILALLGAALLALRRKD